MTQSAADRTRCSASPPAHKKATRSPTWSVLATVAAAAALTYAVGWYGFQTDPALLFASDEEPPVGTIVQVVHERDGSLHAHPCEEAALLSDRAERSALTTALDDCAPIGSDGNADATEQRAVVLSMDWSSVPADKDPTELARMYISKAKALQRDNPSLLVITTTAPAATPAWDSLDADTESDVGGQSHHESDETTAARHAFNQEVRTACTGDAVFLDLDAIEASSSGAALDPARVPGSGSLLLQQRLQEIIVTANEKR